MGTHYFPFHQVRKESPVPWPPSTRALATSVHFLFALLVHSTVIAAQCSTSSGSVLRLMSRSRTPRTPHTLTPLSIKSPLTPNLRRTDADNPQARILRRRASDPYYSTPYLPYFSIKSLYVLAMEAAHKAWANVVDASRIVSARFFLGLATAVWGYTQSVLAVLI